ncbi:LOW QUALITY PROTEIN: hypothetical protein MC885_002242 [Smutsia gigantea]|nr:LOW QUALITY PROTEIN: hypothetical protein MC885_002242 [Smutsia gigantea]
MTSKANCTQNPRYTIMTFYSTKEEFNDFDKYISYRESQGVAKIIAPREWKDRKTYDGISLILIPTPLQQVVLGRLGVFTQYHNKKEAMTVGEYHHLANSGKYQTPPHPNLERKYWKTRHPGSPIYGADISGSLYKADERGHLGTIQDLLEHDCEVVVEGINIPYLCFGIWQTAFVRHTEDMELYSLNLLHFGAPKLWYTAPPEHGRFLDRLAEELFLASTCGCEAFLWHKAALLSPTVLRDHGIPFRVVTQEASVFIVTFPYGYPSGFHHGFHGAEAIHCTEAIHGAMPHWVALGPTAAQCSCGGPGSASPWTSP